jgi:signal transduction histidine kinase
MPSDPSAGTPDAGTRTTTTALRGNGHVDFGPGARAPAPAGNGATDPAAVLALWERDQLLADRERIAADLHDHIIQRLFAVAMNLQRMLGALGPGPLAAQLEMTVDGLDDTIFQLRRMIGRLQRTASVGHGGGAALAGRLLNVLTEVSPALGFNPTVHLTGLNVPLPEDIDEDLLAVLREALTNVARHARADSAEVEVAATADRLTVTVTDDGTGIDAAPSRRSGLHNMDRRAHDHHGAFSAEALHRSGTQVTWTVPLR